MDLEKLKKEQTELSKKLRLIDKIKIEDIKLIAGIDVTYTDIWKNPTTGIACIVVLDFQTLNVVETIFAERTVDFPYIPTFLSYRELDPILKAYDKLTSHPDLFILDGMGIIHPRKIGIASHFGVVTNEISIGCAKSKLIGDFHQPENKRFSYEPLFVDNELRGYVLRSKKNTNPIFISPGNNISIESSLKILMRTIGKYKLPKPTRLAHNNLQIYRKKLLKPKTDG